jgi:hypothetical protein
MKKIILSILILLPIFSIAQTNVIPNYTKPYFQGSVRVADILGVDSLLILPKGNIEYGENLIIKRTLGNPVLGITDIGSNTVSGSTIGRYNVVGTANTIVGNDAIVFGQFNTVSFGGVAFGKSNVINTGGFGSTAIGFSNSVSDRGVGIGYVNSVLGSYGISIGNSAVSNTSAISIGRLSGAATGTRGNGAISIGRVANNGAGLNIGSFGIAIGGSTNSSGEYSTAIGYLAKSNANFSVVIGNGFSSFGGITNNITSSIMLGSGSTTPTMTITSNGFAPASQTGSVGIGTTTPNVSAKLDLTSTTKGFLPPRMTTGQRDAIVSPAFGLIIYNITEGKLQGLKGNGDWKNLH